MNLNSNMNLENTHSRVSNVFYVPAVDVPPYATYRGKTSNFKATNTYPDNWICHNPNHNGDCPIVFCSCCANACCKCNKPALGKKRYITNIRPIYY